jgi:hypothetical protein
MPDPITIALLPGWVDIIHSSIRFNCLNPMTRQANRHAPNGAFKWVILDGVGERSEKSLVEQI